MRFFPYPAVACALVIASAASAPAEDAGISEVHQRLERHMGYFVRDGGKWSAENPAYEIGGNAPKLYGYEYRWDLEHSVVKNTIYGIYEGGVRRDFVESVFAWNAQAEKVEQFLFGVGGGIGRGFENHLDGDVIEAEFVWQSPSGKETHLKDWVKITGADEFDNATFRKDANGNWILRANSEIKFERLR